MADTPLPTPDILRQLLRYESKTGALFWRPREVSWFNGSRKEVTWRLWNHRFAGKEAFMVSPHGYLQGSVLGHQCYAHRVVWAIIYGEWPARKIDHINGIRSDNRISNLRVVSDRDNARNMSRQSRNRSGVMGVFWDARRAKWRAAIMADGRNLVLGFYDNLADAVAARKAAEVEHGYHENHGRDPISTTLVG